MIVLVGGRVALSDDVDELLASHRLLTGRRRDLSTLPAAQSVIEARHSAKQTTLLVRTREPILDPSWTVTPVTLDDIVLAYMKKARDGSRSSSPRLAVA
jgi:ABC-2 type transport system ATP-binding protein